MRTKCFCFILIGYIKFKNNLNNFRSNQLPRAAREFVVKTIQVNWVVNLCQFEDDFFVTKIRFTLFATKINKNLELSFVFVQMNAAHCIGGQNKKYDNEYCSAVSFLWDAFL